MECMLSSLSICGLLPLESNMLLPLESNMQHKFGLTNLRCTCHSVVDREGRRRRRRRLPKNLRYPRRPKLPPDLGVNLFLKKPSQADFFEDRNWDLQEAQEEEEEEEQEENGGAEKDGGIVWEADEIEAITSLFQGRIPQKPGNLNRERPLPLPTPHKLRPLGLPTPKRRVKEAALHVASSRSSVCQQLYKDPRFLIRLAKQMKDLRPEEHVSLVLDDFAPFLRKGSLSLTIRELGLMGLPGKALQTFCWAQKQGHLFPDDKVLGSTVEVLAKSNHLKLPFHLEEFVSLASRGVIEAMTRGLIGGGRLKLAWKLLSVAQHANRLLDAGIYAKLILELGKNPDKYVLAEALLDQLAEREDLDLSLQDCTAIMKVCVRLQKFDAVENLFSWYIQSAREPSVIMYTTLIHSRYSEQKFREALLVVWEMEGSDCLFDLPAYRVVIKLFVALNDLSRAVRYFCKLKEAGFSPTFDIYRDMITIFAVSGRLAKCREIWKDAELAGFHFDKQMMPELWQLEQ